ncbi:MAG: sigma54 specific transcriptional regulator, Fis family, partial [Clostridiales bacterium]|nr:sigma54 specific transcriptional regulator, Fis family [Clostridiales bacterium]
MAKILLILPNEETLEIVNNTIEEHKHYYNSIFNTKEDLDIEITVSLKPEEVHGRLNDKDIIVARGMMATKLKILHQNITVVEIPITTIDIISAIQVLQKDNIINEPVALIGTGDIHYQAHLASQLCNISVVPFNHKGGKFKKNKE